METEQKIGALVKKYVLVMTARKSALVGFNPASWVVLLHKVTTRLR